ncbi:capsule biosynthesis GfcC family protein [Enterovibrio sp. ZSDZ35]|uniref:Capsule biosynthesis GfcC family protein n=1 Tax=Enterovibrio qingdaonensis TaxID=2899818 RepID=A0ABT5QNL8_9GAMM|nr:capsule biosynthesis GfcC family protein [Enterovibrio sp. ZSDZ35]MDD1782464.1 capsule biosynthesis GfcC family protein [Enterovibrio sp. ZSDZ35]
MTAHYSFTQQIKSFCPSMPFSYLTRIVTFLFISVVTSAHAENNNLTVITAIDSPSEFKIRFDGVPRASQIASQGTQLVRSQTDNTLAHGTDAIYWLGAGLFDNDTGNAEQLLSSVNKMLSHVTQIWQNDDEKLEAVKQLQDFIHASLFKTRIPVTLDEDFYLAGSRINPLVDGNLTLLLPKRSDSVQVIGAVLHPQTVPFSVTHSADDYLSVATPLHSFGNSTAFVVQPNGEIEEHPIAYWNAQPKNIAPGAIVYMPFQRLPSALSSLNTDIVQLLQHRVM